MVAKWEKTEENKGKLTVEVDKEKVDRAMDRAFKKVVKKVNIPGFRKGKVPRFIFEQRFGAEALYEDTVNLLLPDAYSEAVKETEIEPVAQPEVDVEQIEKGKNFIFKAIVTVKPEVKLGEYKGLEIVALEQEVTDEDVDHELKHLQEKFAELVVKEEGKAENGDTVVIDFEGFVDGELFEGGKGENHSLELGSDSFIPGFEEQLVGVLRGEEKDVKVTFPEDYHAKELNGKDAIFKVKVHEIKQKEYPELDDEFAKDTDENVETLEELRRKIRSRLKDQKKQAAEANERDTVVQKVSENAKIHLPEAMIENEQDRMMKEFEQRMEAQGINMDMYFQFSGTDEAGLREQMKDEAEKRLRANLVLEAISKKENIEVSDEEIEKEIEKIAEAYKQSVDEVKKLLDAQGGREGIIEDLKLRNTITFLVGNAQIVKEDSRQKKKETNDQPENVEEEIAKKDANEEKTRQ